MLLVNEVTKKYDKILANDKVSITLNNGEVGVLVGPNGSGKSTLIKCIAGLLRYTGDIEIDGLPIRLLRLRGCLDISLRCLTYMTQ